MRVNNGELLELTFPRHVRKEADGHRKQRCACWASKYSVEERLIRFLILLRPREIARLE